MRILLLLWAFPLVFFWGWYGLSAYDINFGIAFLTRRTHDVVFHIYGNMLGMPAADVPLALVKIFAFDSMFIFALAAWRWRKSWYPQAKQWLIVSYHSLRGINQKKILQEMWNQEDFGQAWYEQDQLSQESAKGL
jgi:hypothetical protein